MASQSSRAQINLAMLESVARKLGSLKDEFVFLGGCTTALFITDTLAPDVRTTLDVDCIVDVLSLSDYYKLQKRLNAQGFKESMEDDVLCRWHYDDIILDVMPTDEKILGFGNDWYKAAIKNAITHQLTKDLLIKLVTPLYFLAIKLEAFKARGKNDFLASHDLEDIIMVIDGRIEIVSEVESADITLRQYLEKTFLDLLNDERFRASLPGHLNYGPATQDRTKMILERIKKIANTT